MDNKNESHSWTDPITGEVYQSGNPHVSIQKSTKAADPNVKVTSFREQEQPEQEIYPQRVNPTPPVPPARPTQLTKPGNIPQIIERPQIGTPISGGITKFCEQCGGVIAKDASVCPLCGSKVAASRQIQAQPIQQPQPLTPINVTNSGKPKDKWVALLLCFFFGNIGLHRFYEGKFGTGILYFFTFGLFGIGWLVDLVRIACKPREYYV